MRGDAIPPTNLIVTSVAIKFVGYNDKQKRSNMENQILESDAVDNRDGYHHRLPEWVWMVIPVSHITQHVMP